MLTLRKNTDRGHTQLDWLDSYHSFSFGDYRDEKHMNFGPLRVINEDWVEPGQGFGMHPHRDMEIITYVLEGSLEHRDSLGNGSMIRPGEVQRMSAGTGIMHSEFNPSNSDRVHLLQIWIMPDKSGLIPSYDQQPIVDRNRVNELQLLVSRDGEDNSLSIHQDVNLSMAFLETDFSLPYTLSAERQIWLQVAFGSVRVAGHTLNAGDGASINQPGELAIEALEPTELLLFDMKKED